MIKAVCERACYWHGHYWEKGKPYEGQTMPPAHFHVLEGPEETPAKRRGKAES